MTHDGGSPAPGPAAAAVTGLLPVSLRTADGVRLDGAHIAGAAGRDLAIVVVHAFTGSWRRVALRRVAEQFSRFGGVIVFDLRGHGRSGGISTLGDREIADLAAAVDYAKALGYRRVAAVGFSMGGSVALRFAAITGGLGAVVSVSSPQQWNYRGTPAARRVQWAIHHPLGRLAVRVRFGTRVCRHRWQQVPLSPAEAAARITSVPLLIVHGDEDPYLPLDQARRLFQAANGPKDLWIEHGLAHADANVSHRLITRIGRWIAQNSR